MFDKVTRYARANLGVPADWHCYNLSVDEDEVAEGYIRAIGACCQAITRGKRKGEPNYRKMFMGTRKTFFIKSADLHAWADAQEKAKEVDHAL